MEGVLLKKLSFVWTKKCSSQGLLVAGHRRLDRYCFWRSWSWSGCDCDVCYITGGAVCIVEARCKTMDDG